MKRFAWVAVAVALPVASPALATPTQRQPAEAELLEQARAATGEQRYTEAEALLRRALGIRPSAEAKRMLADVRAWKGDIDGAVTLYRELRASSTDPTLLLALASALSWKKSDPRALEEALALFDSYLASNPNAQEVVVQRARALGWAGRSRQAAEGFEQARRAAPSDALLLEQARVLAQSRDPKDVSDSLPLFDDYLGRNAADADARLARARARGWAGATRLASSDYDELLRDTPNDDLALEQAVMLARSKDKLDVADAIPKLRKHLSKHPEDGKSTLVLARALAWTSDAAGSEAAFRGYLEQYPNDEDARREAAIALGSAKEPALAIPFFERHIANVPQDLEARIRFARVLVWSGQAARAEAMLIELRTQHPGRPDVDVEYARLLSQTGRRVEAMALLDSVLLNEPSHAGARELHELLLLEFHSSMSQSFNIYTDRDKINVTWARSSAYVALGRTAGVLVDVAPYSLSDARESHWALQANGGLRLRPHRRVELSVTAGPRLYEYFSPHYGGHAKLQWAPIAEIKLVADYSYDDAYSLLIQPASVAARVWVHELALSTEIAYGRLSVAARGAAKVATPENQGVEAAATASYRVLGPMRIGYATQWLMWKWNDPAYWSPQGYASHLGVVRAADTRLRGKLSYDLQGAIGIAGERIERVPDSGNGVAYAVGAALHWKPLDRLAFRVSGTYSQTVRQVARDTPSGTSGQVVRTREESTYWWAAAMASATVTF